MSYSLEGTIHLINEAQTFGSGFTKREFVVRTAKDANDQYPQYVKLTATKERITALDRFRVGQAVKVSFDVRGNEHNGRYFVDLQAWKIEAAGGPEQGGQAQAAPTPPQYTVGRLGSSVPQQAVPAGWAQQSGNDDERVPF